MPVWNRGSFGPEDDDDDSLPPGWGEEPSDDEVVPPCAALTPKPLVAEPSNDKVRSSQLSARRVVSSDASPPARQAVKRQRRGRLISNAAQRPRCSQTHRPIPS